MPKRTKCNKIDFKPYIKVIHMLDAFYLVEVQNNNTFKIIHKIKTND